MRNKLTNIAIIGLLIFSFGCSKDDIEGPELQDIFGEFEVINGLTTNMATADFMAGDQIEFSAKLSIRTDWFINIEGLDTGAKKVIEGRERDVDGTVASWNGTTTFAPLFEAEECQCYMTFAEYPDTLWADNVTVLSKKPADDIDLIFTDFENSAQGYNAFAELAAFNQWVTGTNFQNLFTQPASFEEVNPAESDGYWIMSANNTASIFICGMSIVSESATQASGPYLDFGTLNPENVYFNAFVRGFGNANANMSVGFQEDDNMDGVYDRFTEGTYGKVINVDWDGWKLVSFPLSETALSTSGGFGNLDATGQKDLDRVINVEFLLLAAEGTSGFTGYGMDYVNFTKFQPWAP